MLAGYTHGMLLVVAVHGSHLKCCEIFSSFSFFGGQDDFAFPDAYILTIRHLRMLFDKNMHTGY
jgi:hypothetical protein